MEMATNQNNKEIIQKTILETSATLVALAKNTIEIEKIADALLAAYKRGNKMVLFGNGGSAADAQHLAAELVGSYANRHRKALPALALTTDTSALTAIGKTLLHKSNHCQ